MAIDRTYEFCATLDADLYTFLRHARPETIAQATRSLRFSAPQRAAFDVLQALARASTRAEFESHRAIASRTEPAADPLWSFRRARDHRAAAAQAREHRLLANLLAGKRVALVGPSQSIIGSQVGATIDAYDVVVRMNFQWPIDPARTADLGTRLDLLYHCCNGDFPIADLFIPAFAQTRFVCWQANAESFTLEAYCLDSQIPSLDVSSIYADLETRLQTPPFTGTVAIEHLRQFDIAELYLTGISFLAEPYYPDYRGRGVTAAGRWRHDPEPQQRYFRTLIASDPRLRLDPTIQRLLDQ